MEFVEQYALSKENAKAEKTISSKGKESLSNASNIAYQFIDSFEALNDKIIESPKAALVYFVQKDSKIPHSSVVEDIAANIGDYFNVALHLVEDPSQFKENFRGKLPQFRFFKNLATGDAKK